MYTIKERSIITLTFLKDEAINCAKYVSGSVKVVEDDGEKEIFNSKKQAK